MWGRSTLYEWQRLLEETRRNTKEVYKTQYVSQLHTLVLMLYACRGCLLPA